MLQLTQQAQMGTVAMSNHMNQNPRNHVRVLRTQQANVRMRSKAKAVREPLALLWSTCLWSQLQGEFLTLE